MRHALRANADDMLHDKIDAKVVRKGQNDAYL